MAVPPSSMRPVEGSAVERVEESRYVLTFPEHTSGYRRNHFQLAQSPRSGFEAMSSSSVYAVVSVIAQDVARVRVHHKRRNPRTNAVDVVRSPIDRVLQRPNDYQTRSDFWLVMLMNLLLDGNAYAYTVRDRSGRPLSMHPRAPHMTQPLVDPQTGAVFYQLSLTEDDPLREFIGSRRVTVPARDVLHVRLFPGEHPLLGMSPLRAAIFPIVHGRNIQEQQTDLFSKRAHPDGVLSFKTPIKEAYAKSLAEKWNQRYGPMGEGGVAILDGDATWTQTVISANDAQLVEQYRLTIFDVARIYRVPSHMMGLTEEGGPQFSNAETLSRLYYNQCLGFHIEHLEAGLDKHFDLVDDDGTEFEVERMMMRTDFAVVVESLTKAVQGGLMTPNEARAVRNLEAQEGGEAIYLQRQMRRLDEPEPEPVAPNPPAAPAPPADEEARAAVARLEAELERGKVEAAKHRLELAHQLGTAASELAALRAQIPEVLP